MNTISNDDFPLEMKISLSESELAELVKELEKNMDDSIKHYNFTFSAVLESNAYSLQTDIKVLKRDENNQQRTSGTTERCETCLTCLTCQTCDTCITVRPCPGVL